LSVERDEPDERGDPWPACYLKFEHEPELFDVRTDENATVRRERVSPGKFKVAFIGSGWGDPPVAAGFRIDAH
jgi:hypothetical protein